MAYFVKTLGIFILVVGVLGFMAPGLLRKMIDWIKVGKKIYLAAVFRIIIGVLLLLAIPAVVMSWIPGLIGTLLIISGALIFVLGMQKAFAFLDKIYTMPDSKIRIIPVVAAAIGALLIYSV